MHFRSLLLLLTTTLTTARLPTLILPSNTTADLPSLSPFNLTTEAPWPRIPWTYPVPVDRKAVLAIEYYGRSVCTTPSTADVCKEGIRESMNVILVDKIAHPWDPTTTDASASWSDNGVVFWITLREELQKEWTLEIMRSLLEIQRRYVGCREITHGALIYDGILAAEFNLTFPGVEQK